jgi:chitodextrinase
VAGYRVVRNGTVLPGTVTALSFTDTGLAGGTQYTYTVRAVDAAGNVSGDSPPATVTTSAAADTSAPSAPASLSAGNVTVSSVDLAWAAATDNVGVAGYRVVRNGTVLPGTVTALAYTDTGLSPGTQYTYTVRALDAAGNTSVDSPPATITTSVAADTVPPTAPATLTAGNVTTSSVDLTWAAATDNVGVTGYRVVRNGTVLPGTVTALAYTDTGLSPGTQYTYTVRALDAAGNTSVDSPPATITTSVAADTVPPTAPATLTAGNVTTSSVDLTWAAATDNVGVTGYRVVRNGTVLPGTVTALAYTDTGLSPGTQYTYTVRAVDAAGNTSVDSPPATTTTPWFTEAWSGADGSAWSSAWTATSSNGAIDTQTGAGRMQFNDAAGAYARAQLSGVTAQTDTDLLFSYQWASTGPVGYFGLYMRGSGGWQNSYRPRTGYGIELASNSRSVSVVRNVNGVVTTLQTVSGGQQVTTAKQWLRLRVVGSQIQFRTWLDGQAEPTTWNTTLSDTSVTGAGQVFLALNRGSANVGAKSILLDDLRMSATP